MQEKPTLGRPNTLNVRNVSITLPQELIEKIDQLCESRFFASRSETIRVALEEYLKNK